MAVALTSPCPCSISIPALASVGDTIQMYKQKILFLPNQFLLVGFHGSNRNLKLDEVFLLKRRLSNEVVGRWRLL